MLRPSHDGTGNEPAVLRIHHFIPISYTNGPGARVVVWMQGCSLGCPGCYNPATHPTAGGEVVSVDALVDRLLHSGPAIEGITISGGEPLQQRAGLIALLKAIRRRTSLTVLMFTGYSWREIRKMPDSETILRRVDVLIAGRYDQRSRIAHGLMGSANKTLHILSDRYNVEDIQSVPCAEVIIAENGDLLFTGIDPVAD